MVAHAGLIADLAEERLSAKSLTRLRADWGGDAARLFASVASQQLRARAKFGPGVWLATARSIAQATDRQVARYKASLFGRSVVFDLCGGIGGDALELARRGPVVTIDLDPQVSAMAAANLVLDRRAWAESSQVATESAGGSAVAVISADVTRYPLPPDVSVHIDPDRRPRGFKDSHGNSRRSGKRPKRLQASGDEGRTSRVVSPSLYQPTLSQVADWLPGRPSWIVKLAPAAQLEQEAEAKELLRVGHRQWISFDGSVREQSLLGGSVIAAAGGAPGGRSAVRVYRDSTSCRFAVDAATSRDLASIDRSALSVIQPPALIFDFDPAIRAAGLSASFALQQGWVCLGGPGGFWGGDALSQDLGLGWVQCYETLWAGPLDFRRIRERLRLQGLEVQTVKVRGTDHDPEQVLRQLRESNRRSHRPPRGTDRGPKDGEAESDAATDRLSRQITLLIGRHSQGAYAVIGRRWSSTTPR